MSYFENINSLAFDHRADKGYAIPNIGTSYSRAKHKCLLEMKWHMLLETHHLIETTPLSIPEMPKCKSQLQRLKPFFGGHFGGMPPSSNGLKSNICLS